MSRLLDFFTAGPARIQALLVAFLAAVALVASLIAWACWERASAAQARSERDRALDEVAVVSAAAKACSVAADHAKQVGDAAVKATDALTAAAERLAVPPERTVVRTEKIIERTISTPDAGDCNAGWGELERDWKARAP